MKKSIFMNEMVGCRWRRLVNGSRASRYRIQRVPFANCSKPRKEQVTEAVSPIPSTRSHPKSHYPISIVRHSSLES
jgi:hypothetical protein